MLLIHEKPTKAILLLPFILPRINNFCLLTIYEMGSSCLCIISMTAGCEYINDWR